MNTTRPVKLLLLSCLLALVTVLATAPGAFAKTLSARIADAVAASSEGGMASVRVVDLADGKIIYTHRSTRSVAPASNEKLITTVALLNTLGPDFKFNTRLATNGTQTGDTLNGYLYLVGGGDPTLSTPAFAKRNFGRGGNLAALADAVKAAGITTINGRLVVDDTFLDRRRWVGAWKKSFRFDEATALGGLTVNHNYTGKWLSGKSTRKPDIWAGEKLRKLLLQRGITITGRTQQGKMPQGAVVFAVTESPPLKTILSFMNKVSDNFTAEILLKDMASIRAGEGTTARGAKIARYQLQKLGVRVKETRVVDGSGLAYSNRNSALGLVSLLRKLESHATLNTAFYNTLAFSGSWGTMKRRLSREPYKGNFAGKTGTLNMSSTLSGYVTRVGGRKFSMSVVVYGGSQSINAWNAHRLQDRIAKILVR